MAVRGGSNKPQPRVIIKGDEAEILRAPHAHLLGRLQKANGHEKICHKDSIRDDAVTETNLPGGRSQYGSLPRTPALD